MAGAVFARQCAFCACIWCRFLKVWLIGICRLAATGKGNDHENRHHIDEWLAGARQIPPWVRQAIGALELPGGLALARATAAEMIVCDNLRPELGEFPYLIRKDAAE